MESDIHDKKTSSTNPINVIIVLIVVILLSFIAFRFSNFEEQTLTFSGPNIYRAVYVYQLMESQGYLANLRVEGRWQDTNEPFNDVGLITSADKGRFNIEYQGHSYSIGGSSSAVEDIAADRLHISPLHDGVIKIGITPVTSQSLSLLLFEINGFVEDVIGDDNSLYNVGIKGDLLIDVDTTLKPTIVQEVDNVLKPDNDITLFEKGLRISFSNADLSDLEELISLFSDKNIIIERVATGDMLFFIRTNEPVSISTQELLPVVESSSFDSFLVTIINQPLS